MNMTDIIIKKIKQCESRDEAAEHYKNADYFTGIEWGKINTAIIKKWSLSGLKYIKKKAWE